MVRQAYSSTNCHVAVCVLGTWEVTEYVVVDCAAAGKHSAGERNGPDRGGGLSVTEHSGFGVIGQERWM